MEDTAYCRLQAALLVRFVLCTAGILIAQCRAQYRAKGGKGGPRSAEWRFAGLRVLCELGLLLLTSCHSHVPINDQRPINNTLYR